MVGFLAAEFPIGLLKTIERETQKVVIRACLKRRLLSTTDTLLNAIAALAMMGESSMPVNG